jgi:hypothetical protein
MKIMEKTALKIIVVGLILIVLTIFLAFMASAVNETPKKIEQNDTWTKAICNSSNLCQDYIIACKNKNVISITPITGAVVKFSDNWHDSRDKETQDRIC